MVDGEFDDFDPMEYPNTDVFLIFILYYIPVLYYVYIIIYIISFCFYFYKLLFEYFLTVFSHYDTLDKMNAYFFIAPPFYVIITTYILIEDYAKGISFNSI